MKPDDMKTTAADFAGDAGGAARRVRNSASEALDQAADRLNDVSSCLPSGSDAFDRASEAVRGGGETLLHRAAAQPLEALLLAGAIGYLVGWAANRS